MNFNNIVDSILKEQSVIQAPFQSNTRATPTAQSPKPFTSKDIEALAKTFGDPNYALNLPVSYYTQYPEGPGSGPGQGESYGANVTLDSIIRRAKNSLQTTGHNPQDKQNTLTLAANALQDWAIGMNQDNKIPVQDRIDDQTREHFLDMFSNLSNVEKFIGAIDLPNQSVQQPKPLPGHGPAITPGQKEAEQFKAVGDNELLSRKHSPEAYKAMSDRWTKEFEQEGYKSTPEEQEYQRLKSEYVRRYQQRPPADWTLQQLKLYLSKNR